METYKAPLTEYAYLIRDVFALDKQAQKYPALEDSSWEQLQAVLEELAKFAANEVAPLARSGDEKGVSFKDGVVQLPPGWAKSYQLYAENGWPLLEAPEQWGGSPQPAVVGTILSEVLGSSNLCWGMLPALTTAAVGVIHRFATEDLKQRFLPQMAAGQWMGTMCLTEAHCGTDLSLVRTRATPHTDGSYVIDGAKIFITGGDHDAVENIVHLVLARLPDAPEGTKGISLFMVPKHKVDASGQLQGLNNVTVGSIEHKMGIKASPTCVLNFEKSQGYLLGEPHAGLAVMFHMMNEARIGTGIQGYAASAASLQGALRYAKDRLQMRSLSGPKNPSGPADPLIVHPDVRRMILTQKALAEGCRALTFYASGLLDQERYGEPEVRQQALAKLSFLTPIIKGFSTEVAIETTNLGIQVYGGHGYICEWGMEQIARDARISSIYEGATAVQALDLLGRKVLANRGQVLQAFGGEIQSFCQGLPAGSQVAALGAQLLPYLKLWGEAAQQVGQKAGQNPEEVGAAAVDFLMLSGYVTLGYFWLKMMGVSESALATAEQSAQVFHRSKLKTAQFYFARLLPRAHLHLACIQAGSESLMAADVQELDQGVLA